MYSLSKTPEVEPDFFKWSQDEKINFKNSKKNTKKLQKNLKNYVYYVIKRCGFYKNYFVIFFIWPYFSIYFITIRKKENTMFKMCSRLLKNNFKIKIS